MDESEDEAQNRLSEENWMKQDNCKYMKYVIHHRHPMTPEQLKQKPFEEIFKNQHEKVDTDEGESIEEEEKSTTSSEKSKQDSEPDINVDDNQDEQNSHTPETLQNNIKLHDKDNSIHDEYDTSEDENTIELKHSKTMGRKFMKQKSQYLWKNLKFLLYSTKQYIMKMIHQMTNLRLELNHQNRTNSLLPNFKLKLKTEKAKGS